MKKDYLITGGLLLVVILLGVFLYVNYGPGNNRVSYNNQETPATSESDDNVTSTPSADETPASTPTSTPTATADSGSETTGATGCGTGRPCTCRTAGESRP